MNYTLQENTDFDDIPSKMKLGVLYLIKGDNYISFQCPCACGTVVNLPVGPVKVAGKWALTKQNGTVTLSPSILMIRGCKAHFWIKENVAVMC